LSSYVWTDNLGRTYEYEPYEAQPIADLATGLSESAALAVAEASRALGTVPGLPGGGIASILYRSESSASSIIEDIAVGPRRILEAEVATADEIRDPIATRIITNLDGLRDALTTPFPAGPDDYLRWHRLLTEGHPRMKDEDIGAYRTQQNWIGGDGYGPRNAVFIPPRPEDIGTLVIDLAQYTSRNDISPVVQAAIAHARFEVIHPFTDGNGRVGRMLIQHVLAGRISLHAPVPVSIPWSHDKDGYIEGLRNYQEGVTDAWIEYFGMSVVAAVSWMHSMEGRLTSLLSSLQDRSRSRGSSVSARVIHDLAIHPIVNADTVAERYDVSRQAAHQALVRLAEDDVLTERSFSRRIKAGRPRQMFTSTELLDLLSEIVTD